MHTNAPLKRSNADKDPDEFIRNAMLLVVVLAVLVGLVSGSVEGANAVLG